jgi:hypothetical protein
MTSAKLLVPYLLRCTMLQLEHPVPADGGTSLFLQPACRPACTQQQLISKAIQTRQDQCLASGNHVIPAPLLEATSSQHHASCTSHPQPATWHACHRGLSMMAGVNSCWYCWTGSDVFSPCCIDRHIGLVGSRSSKTSALTGQS